MFCGKIAAGKSTLARQLAQTQRGILVAEDAWLAALFAEEMKTGADYMRCSGKLRAAMEPHLEDLLSKGLTLVLDFQANTTVSRRWMRGLLEATGADHTLHVLTPPDAVCLARLQARNAAGTHPFTVSEAQFHQFARYFEPPAPEEGFNLLHHDD